MVKRLLMVAALLAPAVAYGSDPGNNLSVQILPAASPAPPPSGGPSPPTEAANAGFTTLAANYDFSTAFYANQSNWLDWVYNSGNTTLQWHNGSGTGVWSGCGNGGWGSNNLFQTTDEGHTVLDIQWPTSVSNETSGNCNFMQMATVNDNCYYEGYPGCGGTTFPNMYVETIYREDQGTSEQANGIGPNGIWSWQLNPNGTYPLELDYGELYGNNTGVPYGDSARHNWQANTSGYLWVSYGSNNLPPGYSELAYHKYGMLLTSDGATAEYACSYVDDILQGCQNVGAESPQFTNRNFLIAWNGNYLGGSEPTVNMYLQYIRVWSCANWNGSSSPANQCNGSTLYNSAGLTYWH